MENINSYVAKYYYYLILLIIFVVVIPVLLSGSPYYLHIVILILLWGYFATVWSYMARFGMVSLGHGLFVAIGAYTSGLLFQNYMITPLIGMLLGAILAGAFAAFIGYFCYRTRVAGHYFAILTLALGAVSYHLIVYLRGITGGSLGMSLTRVGFAPLYLQFPGQRIIDYFLFLFLLAIALIVWRLIDRSKLKYALVAISDDEEAAKSVGVNIIHAKVFVTTLSGAFTAVGGALFAQYMRLLNPDIMAGVETSLFIAFKALLGGLHYLFGPLLGSGLMVSIEEYIRIEYGSRFLAYSDIAYAVIIVLLIIYSPRGVMGFLENIKKKIKEKTDARNKKQFDSQTG